MLKSSSSASDEQMNSFAKWQMRQIKTGPAAYRRSIDRRLLGRAFEE
jgi:hypothetical protein